MRGEATGDNCVDDMREFLFEGGGKSETKDGASERVVENSSYEVMSENPPVVDMVNDEPDMRRPWFDPCSNLFTGSFSIGCPEYLRSMIGIASSEVKAWPMFISPSKLGISRLSSHGFDVAH